MNNLHDEIKQLRAKLEALEATLCTTSVVPRKPATTLPSWLKDDDLLRREKRLSYGQHLSDKQRIESACYLALQGWQVKECATLNRVDRKTIKVAFGNGKKNK